MEQGVNFTMSRAIKTVFNFIEPVWKEAFKLHGGY